MIYKKDNKDNLYSTDFTPAERRSLSSLFLDGLDDNVQNTPQEFLNSELVPVRNLNIIGFGGEEVLQQMKNDLNNKNKIAEKNRKKKQYDEYERKKRMIKNFAIKKKQSEIKISYSQSKKNGTIIGKAVKWWVAGSIIGGVVGSSAFIA